MSNIRYIYFLMVFCLLLPSLANGQFYFREEWKEIKQSPDSISVTNTLIDVNGHVVIASSYFDSIEGSNVIVSQYNSSGTLLWTQVWNSSFDLNDFAIDLAIDHDNNYYVVAASVNGPSMFYDMAIIKMNDLGQHLWDTSINLSTGNCFPLKLELDLSSNCYVTGTEVNGSNDAFLVKFDSSGSFQWHRTIDNGFDEFGASIIVDDALPVPFNTRVTVYGGSKDSTGLWKHVSAVYNASGTMTSSLYSSVDYVNMTSYNGISKGLNHDYFICGTPRNGLTTGYRIVKLDSSLNVVWIDSSTSLLNQGASALVVDSLGNVLVAKWEDLDNQRNIYNNKI